MALVMIKKESLIISSFYANEQNKYRNNSNLGDYHCELFLFLRLNLVATEKEKSVFFLSKRVV